MTTSDRFQEGPSDDRSLRVLTVRMPAALHARLLAAARAARTSGNRFCVAALERAVEESQESRVESQEPEVTINN